MLDVHRDPDHPGGKPVDAPAPGADRPAPHRRPGLPAPSSRVPALDGLRGLAVAAVVVYHLAPDLLPGGFLGVSVFFVLSGYLITSLLLIESRDTGRIGLTAFWGRRFRRLLPAAMAGLVVAVAVAAVVGDAHQLRTLPGDVAAAAGYVANWRFIAQGTTYGARYQQPSVVQHYWSLAIEEQFYVVVAITAALLARFARRRETWSAVLGAMALGSVCLTLLVDGGAGDPTQVYFGTGTRAFELLAGALLAVSFAGQINSQMSGHLSGQPDGGWSGRAAHSRRLVGGIGAGVALLVALRFVSLGDRIVYRGGLWLAAGLTCLVIVAARQPGPFARALSWRPLTALGLISYGVYLFHWPIFIWLSPETTHLHGLLLAGVRLAATLVVSLASYALVEQPIRTRRWSLRPGWYPALAVATGLSVVVAAVVVGTGAQARSVVAAPDIALPTTSVPVAPEAPVLAPPHQVLFLGDSMLHDALPSMQADLAAGGIDAWGIGGPGQSLMTGPGRWLDELDRAIAERDPDVIVLESCCGTETPWVASDGRTFDPASTPYWDEWRRLVDVATVRAGARGARVLWALPPPADGVKSLWYGDIRGRMLKVAAIERDIAAAHPGVGLIDWGVLAAPDGSFSATLPDRSGQQVEIRAADGVHFTPTGQALQARVTVDQLLAVWGRTGGRAGDGSRAPH